MRVAKVGSFSGGFSGGVSRGLSIVLFAGLCGALAGCGGPPSHAGAGDAGAPGPDGGRDAAQSDVPLDAAACQCKLDSDGILSLSWDCYCAQPFVGCDVPLSAPSTCADVERVDYPACGLTVVVDFSPGASVGLPSVYDSSGTLVGRLTQNNISVFVCPSDPSLSSTFERAGRFPDPSCLAASCAACYAGAFPCPGVDGGADGLVRYDAGAD